ncbi:peptidoglycan bridge formation glycyltransferase FemA/FemB family protein [Candidatus Uhrbacteria bacterium]|nr:peptidoglycan bridge formation glycyltransferase FemA/FemB family protein [Candidatus Uhrbacteria bacterium]
MMSFRDTPSFSHSILGHQAWNSAVVSHPQYSFLQSYEWGEFQKKCGRNVIRYCSRGSGGFINAAQVLSHPLPLSSWYGYCPRGPLVYKKDATRFIEFLSAEMREQGALFVRLEPYAAPPSVPGIVQTSPIQPADIWVVDISQSEESLLSSMRPKTRYNFGVSQKKGVSLQVIASVNDRRYAHTLSSFIAMLSHTAGRHRFRLHPAEYYREMIDFFMQSTDETAHRISLRLYTAYHGTTAIAAIAVLYFGKIATYLHGGSNYEYRDLMAPYALHVQAMKDAAALGFTLYDMGGIAHSDDPRDPWQGITRFKKGFSGYPLRYPGTFDIVFNSFFYSAYSKFRRIHSRLRSSMDRT